MVGEASRSGRGHRRALCVARPLPQRGAAEAEERDPVSQAGGRGPEPRLHRSPAPKGANGSPGTATECLSGATSVVLVD